MYANAHVPCVTTPTAETNQCRGGKRGGRRRPGSPAAASGNAHVVDTHGGAKGCGSPARRTPSIWSIDHDRMAVPRRFFRPLDCPFGLISRSHPPTFGENLLRAQAELSRSSLTSSTKVRAV